MSIIADFYARRRLNCVVLTLCCSVSWSYFDVLSGLIRDVHGSLINVAIGCALLLTGGFGVVTTSAVSRGVVAVTPRNSRILI